MNFITKLPSVGFILSLLKKEEIVLREGKSYSMESLNIVDICELAVFKHPKLSLMKSLPMIVSTIKSAGLIIKF